MMRTMTATAALLMLAACGGGGDAAGNSGDGEATGVTAIEQTPSNLMEDPNNQVVPIRPDDVKRVDTAQPVAAIPKPFLGRWGMTVADCDPSTGADKGSMTIAPDRVSFFESRAVPGNVQATPTRLTADLAFSGEGQTWTQSVTMTLQDDGKTLVREVTKGDDLGVKGAQRHSRCPAPNGTL